MPISKTSALVEIFSAKRGPEGLAAGPGGLETTEGGTRRRRALSLMQDLAPAVVQLIERFAEAHSLADRPAQARFD